MTLEVLTQTMNNQSEKTVVIAGAGFAGLNAAKRLADDPNIKVILVDHKNHHLFSAFALSSGHSRP